VVVGRFESQDAVFERGRRVAQHREVLEVEVGGLNEALTLRSFDRRESPPFDRFGPFAKRSTISLGSKAGSQRDDRGFERHRVGNMETQLILLVVVAAVMDCGSEEWT